MFRLPVDEYNLKGQKEAKKAGFITGKENILRDITNQTVQNLNKQFKSEIGITFTRALRTISVDKNDFNATRKIANSVKRKIEDQWKETSVERVFGTGISLRKRQELRLSQSFEDFATTQNRLENEKKLIATGSKRKLDHIGNLVNYVWDEEDCLKEIKKLPNGSRINFTDLARRYNLLHKDGHRPNNCGQVLKELLKTKNCDFESLQSVWGNSITKSERIRRRKRRLDGLGISMPVEETNSEVIKRLKQKINDGTYSIGKLIVPQTFEKLRIINGKVEETTTTVQGQKNLSNR